MRILTLNELNSISAAENMFYNSLTTGVLLGIWGQAMITTNPPVYLAIVWSATYVGGMVYHHYFPSPDIHFIDKQ